MVLFETYAYLVIVYTLVAPALPWLLARGRSRTAALCATGVALLLLALCHGLLLPACAAANCGQGAILVVTLWGIGAVSAMLTLMVGGLSAYSRK